MNGTPTPVLPLLGTHLSIMQSNYAGLYEVTPFVPPLRPQKHKVLIHGEGEAPFLVALLNNFLQVSAVEVPKPFEKGVKDAFKDLKKRGAQKAALAAIVASLEAQENVLQKAAN